MRAHGVYKKRQIKILGCFRNTLAYILMAWPVLAER